MIKKLPSILISPYTALSICLLFSSPLFFLRGIGIFDDSVFLKIGELIVDGLVPYRDVFDNKPPGIYYLAAVIAAISNNHWLAPRLFLFVFAALFGIWVIKYTRNYWGDLAAYLVAWIFGLSYTITQGYSFHTDQFCAFFGFAAVVAISSKHSQARYSWFLAGLSIGVAFLFKQVAVIYLVAILCFFITKFIGGKIYFNKIINNYILLVTGFAIPQLVTFYIILLYEIFPDFYDAVFISTLPFAEQSINIADVIKLWVKIPAVWLNILCFLILMINKKILHRTKNLANVSDLLLIVVVGCLSLIPSLKQSSNTHYIGSSLVFLSISAAVILSSLLLYLKKQLSLLKIRIIFILIFSIFLAYLLAIIWGGNLMISQQRLGYDLAQMYEIQSKLNLYLTPEEPILALSDNAPRIYYMSGRKPQIKYIYYYGAGWLNSKIPSLDNAANLLVKGETPGAILETTKDALPKHIHDFPKYQLIELSTSEHPVNNTHTVIMVRKDIVDKKS
ncbi:glycosyltransferase family 39 protein [Nostoc linckia FACHB-104]|nr:glycosyltransferase family 39 protein [Nostoc linckia FACHB-104]